MKAHYCNVSSARIQLKVKDPPPPLVQHVFSNEINSHTAKI